MMKWIRKIHKWASLLIAIQFVLWLSSGFYFNLMDHDKASGSQYRQHIHSDNVVDFKSTIEPSLILQQVSAVTDLKLIKLVDNPYFLATHDKGLYPHFVNSYSLFDATTGRKVIIDSHLAERIALQSYNGPGEIISSTLISGKLEDIAKQKNPAWQVNFADDVQTSVYVEAGSGRIVGHSDDDKRFADIFFMLHFMDYTNQASFNSWHNILFAFFTLWLTLSGLIWTVNMISKGKYKVSELTH